MPNEMKPNQSFSPINQGPEAKPLHKRPDNSFVTVTLWTISGVVLAACSGGSNVIRDIGGTFQERVGDNQVVFDAGFTAYNVTLSVALFKDGIWWRELAIEAPHADPEGEDVVLIFRGLVQNQNDTSLPFTFRISSDGPAMTAAEFVAAHGTGFGPIELGEQGFAVGDVAYPLSPDDFGIEAADLGDDVVTLTITDQPDGTGFYRSGTKVTSFTPHNYQLGKSPMIKGRSAAFTILPLRYKPLVASPNAAVP